MGASCSSTAQSWCSKTRGQREATSCSDLPALPGASVPCLLPFLKAELKCARLSAGRAGVGFKRPAGLSMEAEPQDT